ncbi:MAG: 23S rRNA (guanosine(2251)-2'-O)-methyltransferase RlmB [Bacteroidales bacterium]|jgi:23S rRNA (guanosine2251-2'-O)-methyltransferase|nr:23S rRNA (guanosine(2251)-2'-O)-methyltransferase RlmB [Bacteroidales bacterium]
MKNDQMIFGIRPVLEALDAGKELDKILLQKGLRGELFHELMEKVRQYDVPLQLVPIDRLNRITRKNHQGVIAFQSRISYHSIEQILPGIFEKGDTPLILVLDHVTDVRNFGAIARTAESAGVHAILIPSKGSAAINEDAMKTSAGALNIIPVCRADSLENTVKFLKNSGLKIVSSSEKGSVEHYDEKLDLPLAIIMGSEDTGVSANLLRISDSLVSIPQKGKIGSLNVSVAAGVLLYEVLRQRKT